MTLKSFAAVMNNKPVRDRLFEEAKKKVVGGGLLDFVQAYGPDGKPIKKSN